MFSFLYLISSSTFNRLEIESTFLPMYHASVVCEEEELLSFLFRTTKIKSEIVRNHYNLQTLNENNSSYWLIIFSSFLFLTIKNEI